MSESRRDPVVAGPPVRWDRDDLLRADLGRVAVFGGAERGRAVAGALACPQVPALEALPKGLDTLIAVGGGTRIDSAKRWRAEQSAMTQLIAVPTLWGSGADASPVVVTNGPAGKEIKCDPRYLPDVRCVWPELAAAVPSAMARQACGDAWSHALEGFLSPLADEPLRAELAALMREMQLLPLGFDPRWLDLSARACALQARSSVGLVHGIAHQLEMPLRDLDGSWGHAALCSLFLVPVLAFDRAGSARADTLAQTYAVDLDAVLAHLQRLHDPERYHEALPCLERHWKQVLRDPCTRTNCVLVRPAALGHFQQWSQG